MNKISSTHDLKQSWGINQAIRFTDSVSADDIWVYTTDKQPNVDLCDRLWLAVQCPGIMYKTVEGRYDTVKNQYLYANDEPVGYKVIAWKKF